MLSSVLNIINKRIPGQLVIQFTDRCNAKCPQCGMRVTEPFERSNLSLDQVKAIIDSAVQKNIEVVSFTGGEPMLHMKQLIELIDYAGKAGIRYIRTGTNGFLFMNSHKPQFKSKIEKIVSQLAKTSIRNFWISIDSVMPDIHEKMRGFPGVIKGIEKALPVFHEYGIYPSANLGINRNISEYTLNFIKPHNMDYNQYLDSFYQRYCKAFSSFYSFVTNLGFTIVNSCYPMSIDNDDQGNLNPVYSASSENIVIKFTKKEKKMLFKALFDTIPKFRSKIRIFSPLTSLYALQDRGESSYPCRGGIDFFFIDAKDGNTYPCGYRGNENMGKFWDIDLKGLNINSKDCRLCDWECFRDPSELFGPILHGLYTPFNMIKKFTIDTYYMKLWINDLKYYYACNFFNGRTAPEFANLSKFTRIYHS